ncbi:MAG: type II toxin-antitoxin system VapC family toxin [Deltaproteobacteria bacterium]|nr:type II toxin-antitoxin system VapC family toxin [Deltaproteobacteria bacterium]
MSSAFYFDSSALVKRYVREAGSSVVETIFRKNAQIVTAGLTYCELYACFGRLVRLGDATREQMIGVCAAFEADWTQCTIIELTATVRKLVPKMTSSTALRGGDVVQLCSALRAAEVVDHLRFVAADLRLLNAAKGCGLRVIDPTAQ